MNTTAISFGSEVTVFDGSGTDDAYRRPSLALSASGHLWYGAVHYGGVFTSIPGYAPTVRRSSNLASGDLTPLQTSQSLMARGSNQLTMILVPRAGAEMYAVVNGASANIAGFFYNGCTWTTENGGGENSWMSFPSGAINGSVFSMMAVGSSLYVGGEFTSAGGRASHSLAAYGLAIAGGVGPSSEMSSTSDPDSGDPDTGDPDSGDLYLLYTNGSGHAAFRRCSKSIWRPSTLFSDGTVCKPSVVPACGG